MKDFDFAHLSCCFHVKACQLVSEPSTHRVQIGSDKNGSDKNGSNVGPNSAEDHVKPESVTQNQTKRSNNMQRLS
jgi:hypothetical protein